MMSEDKVSYEADKYDNQMNAICDNQAMIRKSDKEIADLLLKEVYLDLKIGSRKEALISEVISRLKEK